MSAAPAVPPAPDAAGAPATTPVAGRGQPLLLLGYALTLFLNAALLFVVQPMFSKMALPLLGGAPAVWNTCMLVFQTLLLAGYLYAHLSTRWLRPRTQLVVHLALLVVSLAALPVMVPAGWTPPPGGAPVPWLVALLLVGLGLPFFLLSTGAPLLQVWFSRTGHAAAANPYFLYAASNAGSMLGLLAYPFVLEPTLGLTSQSRAWSVVYGVVVVLVSACAWVAVRRGGATPAAAAADAASAAAEEPEGAARWTQRLWWTLLAFAPSSLLLGVTTYVTTDMAAFPLLWVIPLALYLLTFVLVFARRQVVPHALMVRLQPVLLLPLTVALFTTRAGDLRFMAPAHLLLFFVTAMVCHGELARLRPGASRLTEFYLWLSIGGVLGGIFNVLLAPVLFTRVLEYQIVLALACALRPWPAGGVGGWRTLRRDVLLPLALFGGLVFLLREVMVDLLGNPPAFLADHVDRVIPVVGGLAALTCLFFLQRPLRLALGALAVMMAGIAGGTAGKAPILAVRSFFGVYGVRDIGGGYHVLYHGTTLHGAQNRNPDWERTPISYYRARGPLSDLFSVKRLAGKPLNVGVVGLGSGSVACFARPGDRFTFYEIDPVMERIARDRRLFTFMSECTPDAGVVLGDARVSLARPTDDPPYDIIVLDAFTSDAIPIHLMTREAMAVYESRLAPDGVIALHVSNRYLNLRPVVANLAADAGMIALLGEDFRLTAEERAVLQNGSVWVAVARTMAPLEALEVRKPRWAQLEPDTTQSLWTDDYSNVLQALVKRR